MTEQSPPVAPPSATDPRAAATVWYDGGCPVCRREIGWYRGMAGGEAIAWIDVADAAAALPAGRTREALLRRFTVARRDGSIVTGAAAFSALWRGLARLRLLGRATDVAPVRGLLELGYRGFLRVRMAWR